MPSIIRAFRSALPGRRRRPAESNSRQLEGRKEAYEAHPSSHREAMAARDDLRGTTTVVESAEHQNLGDEHVCASADRRKVAGGPISQPSGAAKSRARLAEEAPCCDERQSTSSSGSFASLSLNVVVVVAGNDPSRTSELGGVTRPLPSSTLTASSTQAGGSASPTHHSMTFSRSRSNSTSGAHCTWLTRSAALPEACADHPGDEGAVPSMSSGMSSIGDCRSDDMPSPKGRGPGDCRVEAIAAPSSAEMAEVFAAADKACMESSGSDFVDVAEPVAERLEIASEYPATMWRALETNSTLAAGVASFTQRCLADGLMGREFAEHVIKRAQCVAEHAPTPHKNYAMSSSVLDYECGEMEMNGESMTERTP